MTRVDALCTSNLELRGSHPALPATARPARHLLEIVDDVLDISRLEADKVAARPEAVRFRELLDDLLVTARPLSEQHEAEFRLDVAGRPGVVRTDPQRVRQIPLKLLSNAAKFGARRPVEVRCAATPEGGVAVEVEDQGKGIAPVDQERIFEEFVQLDPADPSRGTGLGLPIARRLAALLRGRLTLRSMPGQGSVFRLELPPAME